MVGRDGGGDIGPAGLDKGGGLRSGDVLEYRLQAREIGGDARIDALDEHRLAIEDVHLRRRHLAVHAQRKPVVRHRLERAGELRGVLHGGRHLR